MSTFGTPFGLYFNWHNKVMWRVWSFFLTLSDGDVLLMTLYIRQFPSRTHCAHLVPSLLFVCSTTPKHIQIGLIETFVYNWIFQQNMPIIKHRYDICIMNNNFPRKFSKNFAFYTIGLLPYHEIIVFYSNHVHCPREHVLS